MQLISLAHAYMIVLLAGDGLEDVHWKLAINDRHVLTEAIQNDTSIGGCEI